MALDLAPAAPSVWRADFLQLQIEEMEMEEKDGDVFEINAHGELQTLRAGAFDAVVLSLVLSFLPTPELRRDTCPTSMIFMSAIVLVSLCFPTSK